MSKLAVAYTAGTPGAATIIHHHLDRIIRRLDEQDGEEWAKQVEVDAAADLETREAEKDEAKRLRAELGLSGNHSDLTTTDTAKLLDISTAQVRSAIELGDLPGRQVQAKWHNGVRNFWPNHRILTALMSAACQMKSQ